VSAAPGLREGDGAPALRAARAPSVAARVFASFLVARAIFGIAYIAAAIGRLPVFWYRPLEHTWELAGAVRGPAMGWYGLTGAALVAAAAGGGLTYAASARGLLARSLAKGAVVLAIARAGGLVLFVDFAYFGWTLTHQTPEPWSEPACPGR
jgi:hypothetical protein